MAAQLIAGNFAVPSDEDYAGEVTASAMGSDGIYIWVANLGRDHTNLQAGRWTEASLPISVGREDLLPLEGHATPSEAGRWVIVDGTALLTVVGFGSAEPTESQLAEANAVLSTLELSASS